MSLTHHLSVVHVPAGQDRAGARRSVLGGLDIDVKLSGRDTDGRLCIIEHSDAHKGGPPRHLHHEQEEWFYILAGEYAMEVGETAYHLGPGDSVLAPRQIPHVWAHVGDGEGKLVIAFQPAGTMEAFLDELSRRDAGATPEALAQLFERHGMEIVGRPLLVE